MKKVFQQKLALRVALYILRKNGFSRPAKSHVLNFIHMRNLLRFPDAELSRRSRGNHDRIWENDIAWKRKDLYEGGEVWSPERGLWSLTEHGVARIEAARFKWLKLANPEERENVLAHFTYWTDDLIDWMLRIARDDDLKLGRSKDDHKPAA